MHSARTACGTCVAAAHRSAVGLPPASAAWAWTLDRRYTHATIPRTAATRRTIPAHRIVAAEPNAQGRHRAWKVRGNFVTLRPRAHRAQPPTRTSAWFAAFSPQGPALGTSLSAGSVCCHSIHRCEQHVAAEWRQAAPLAVPRARAHRIPRRHQCTSTHTGQEHRPETRSVTATMGCCCAKEKVNPQAAQATSDAARARHPLSKENNPKDLTILDTPGALCRAER